MNPTEPEITADQLLRHGGWLRRLARQLVRDDPEDLVQEVWAQIAERPPAPRENARSWLGTVLLNRVRSRARSDARRRRRELESAAWPDPPATPEEATARLEVQRQLAMALTQLPEPYKHVVYLRYVEGREPAEIAALTGDPPGTVRWRLKEGLARLRAQLDEGYGGKRAVWVGVLAPLAVSRPAAARPLLVVGAAAVVGLMVVVGFLVSRWGGRDDPAATSNQAVGAKQVARGPSGPVFAKSLSREEGDSCPAVAPMQASLDALKLATDEWRDLRELYAEADPNPKLEEAARPIIESAFSKAGPGCEHSLSCRGMVCDVTFLTPDGADRAACWPKPDESFRDRLSSGMNNSVNSGTPFHDPVSGKSYWRQSQVWRFFRDDARPVPRAERPSLPELRFPGLPTIPAGLSVDCGSRWRRLASNYERIVLSISQWVPERVFAASTPNPALSERVVRWSSRILGRPSSRLPFSVECRSFVCALSPETSDDDPLAIKWQCRQEKQGGPSLCLPERDGNTWYDQLSKNTRGIGRLRFPRRDASGKVHPAHLAVRISDRPRSHRAAVAFADSFDWRASFSVCAARFPTTGTLRTMLEFPEVTGHESAPLHPSFHAGGDLAGTPLGRCVVEAFQAAAGQFAVPPISNGMVLYSDIKFPLDASAFEEKLARMRQTLEEEKAGAAF